MKKLLSMILAATMLFSMASCKGSTPASDESSSGGTTASGSSASAASEAPGTPVDGGTINIAITDDPTTLLGWKVRNTNEGVIAPVIYEYLVRYDETGAAQPYLLESLEEDVTNLTYTMKVRPGITFQDGTSLNAEAVKWNLENYKTNGILSESYFSKVASVEATDDMTVVVHMSEWDSMFPMALGRTCYIVSPTAVKEMGEEAFNEKPVGTGPFMVDSWKHGEGIYTKRYDGYWNGKPHLDGVNVKIYATMATQQAAIESGDLDVIQVQGDATMAESLKAKGFTVVNSVIPASAYTVCFNCIDQGPLTDVRVRQAIAYAIDADGINDALLAGGTYGKFSTQWAFPGSNEYAEIEGYGYDIEKAKKLMEEAGYASGFDLQITYQTADFSRDACQIISAQLAELGINLTLNEVEVANYVNYIGKWDGLLFHPMGATNGQFSQIAANMITGARFGPDCFLHTPESLELIDQAVKSDRETASKDLKRVVEILFQENVEMYALTLMYQTAIINPNLKESGINEVLPYVGNWHKAYLAS